MATPQPTPTPTPKEIIYIAKGQLLATGSTAFLERLPSGDVVKTPTPTPYYPPLEYRLQGMRTEAQVYKRLGAHPRIPRFIDWDSSVCCLTIEYLANGSLGEFIAARAKHPRVNAISLSRRRRWAKQAAEGVRLLHAHGVIHGDISPRNFLLDGELDLKIADFAGSSFSDSRSEGSGSGLQACAFPLETRFHHPSCEDEEHLPRLEDDVFGLGSLIYFIMTGGVYPYGDVESDAVRELFQGSRFPDVSRVAYGGVIERCWRLQVDAGQVYGCFE